MPQTAAEALERFFTVTAYPAIPSTVALTDGVDKSAVQLCRERGMESLDLIQMPVVEALQEIERRRVSAILGRGGLDENLEQADEDVVWPLRDSGVKAIGRLGNGATMKVNEAFNGGIVTLRTPEGNARAVRIWQDLMLMAMTATSPDFQGLRVSMNPVMVDDTYSKEGKTEKYKWNWDEVYPGVNPESKPFDQASETVKIAAEKFRDKKVALIGPGVIGMEVIRNSPFLKYANIIVYDVVPRPDITEAKVVKSKEEALTEADLVLLHLDGKDPIITKRELNLLRPGAMICNCARGGNIDPKALLEAIESGQVSKAGLDTHVVEGEKLEVYKDLPPSREDWKPGHYATALRMSSKVIATNHSAASEIHAQIKNAQDGILAIHAFNTRGAVQHGVGAPDIEFPSSGFIDQRGGAYIPLEEIPPGRFALELFHNGDVEELISTTYREICAAVGQRVPDVRGPLGQIKLNRVSGDLRRKNFKGQNNSISFECLDLPKGIGEKANRKLFLEMALRAESVPGIHRAQIFVPRRRK